MTIFLSAAATGASNGASNGAPTAATTAATTGASLPPPLTARGHAWRVAVMLTISALGWLGAVGLELDVGLWLVILDLGVGVAALVLVFWRRRWPQAVALALALLSTVSITASGPGLLALASLATRRRPREFAPVAAVAIACWVLFERIIENPSPLWQVVALSATSVLGAVVAGVHAGYRRERASARSPVPSSSALRRR